MPKKSLKINQFHGGLNNYRDRRDTPDDALVNASNVMVDVPGKIRMMGGDEPIALDNNSSQIDGLTTPGYGLFAFTADHDMTGANTQDAEFIVYQSQNNFHIVQDNKIYKPGGGTGYEDGGISCSTWTGTSKPDFLYSNERLFISDSEFLNSSSSDSHCPYVFEFLSHQRFPTESGSYNSAAKEKMNVSAGWYTNKASYPKITDLVIAEHASIQNSDSDNRIKVNVENNTDGISQWEAQEVFIGVSTLYGDEESRIQYTSGSGGNATLTNAQGALLLGLSIRLDASVVTLDKRITGFKVYLMGTAPSTSTTPTNYKDPYLLATADMINETFTSHEGEVLSFVYSSGAAVDAVFNTGVLTIKTLPTTTFEIENLYSYDVETIRAKWKTSTQIGNSLYVGNVRTLNDTGNEVDVNPDKILRGIAPVGTKRMGVFPSTDFLDVTVGDGDEIVALESFADKLLVFKRRTVFIINVSGDIEYIELEKKFVGISNPYNVVKTELGIAWVNPQGAFLYDGEKIVNLTEGKLDSYVAESDDDVSMPGWTNFIGEADGGQVGYIAPLKQLVVFDSPVNPGVQGNIFIFDFRTASWTYGTDRISNYPRSAILSGYKESFIWLGAMQKIGNSTYNTTVENGSPAEDYIAKIIGLNDEMVTSGVETYELKLSPSGVSLTGQFTYTGSGGNLASLIAEKIQAYDASLEILVNDDFTEIEIKRSSVDGTEAIPAIFGQTISWDTTGTNVVPDTSASPFIQAGIGHAVAPVRAWYQEEAMNNLSNHEWGGQAYSDLAATWGGNPTDSSVPFNISPGNFPPFFPEESDPDWLNIAIRSWYNWFFAGQNTIYPWILNELRKVYYSDTQGWSKDPKVNQYELDPSWMVHVYSGTTFTPHYENAYENQFSIDDWYGVSDSIAQNLYTGRPWGYRGFHPNKYQILAAIDDADTNLFGGDISGGFDPNEEYESRNSQISPLISYTGFVMRPSAHNGDDGNPVNTSDAYGIQTTLPKWRSNPRLIKYMCDFPENTSLGEGTNPSENSFVLPSDSNQGGYVSPGLLFTQAWTEGDDHDYIEELKERSPDGNGHYKNDPKSQVDSVYPNGYFFLGYGHGAGDIIEGVGGTASDKYSIRKVNNEPGMNNGRNAMNSELFKDLYFLSRAVEWNKSDSLEEDNPQLYQAQRSISEDILEPSKHRIFRNFGDMTLRGRCTYGDNLHGEAIDDYFSTYSWGGQEFNDYDSNYSPSILLRDSIPFNQQSLIENRDNRQNPITRDEAFITEQNGIYTISSLRGNDDWLVNQYARPGQFGNQSELGTPGSPVEEYQEWTEYATYTDNQPICYTSMPYLVIEVIKGVDDISKVVLHMICDPEANKGHALNDIISYTVSGGDGSLDYSLTDATITGATLIDFSAREYYEANINGMTLVNNVDINEISCVDNETWGINGYLTLEFNYSVQSDSVKDHMRNSSGMFDNGTVAFWSNSLKNVEASTEGTTGNHIEISSTKDPVPLDYENSSISGIAPSLASYTSSFSPYFNIISSGTKGVPRKVVFNAARVYDSDSLGISLTARSGNYNSSVANNAIYFDSDNGYDSMYNIMTSDSTSLLNQLDGENSSIYKSVTNIVRTLASANTATSGAITFPGDETDYFRAGDAIWFETLVPTAGDLYLIDNISYDNSLGNTTITLNNSTPPTHGTTISGSNIYKSLLSTADISYLSGANVSIYGSGLLFTGNQSYLQDDLEISGSFSGSINVMTFKNNTEWIEKEDTEGGSFYIETKDFDFGNPSTLKNINYVDISMKCKVVSSNGIQTESIPRVEYAINNTSNWNIFDLGSEPLINQFKTLRYKLGTGSIKNVNSIRIRIRPEDIELGRFVSFELNDITIVYREKDL